MGSIPGNVEREPIAIIGLATRFPQDADTVENLWSFLLRARQAMTDFPSDRLNSEAHYHPDAEHGGTFHVKGANFFKEDPVLFDAPFFKATKSELWTLDPQQRLIMENTYHALENAGIPISHVTGSRTAVYTSGFNTDHAANLNMDPEVTLKYKPQGTSNSIIAGRVSWFYDLKGPSMTLDTACSSTMTALHLACQSLQVGESNMGIVAGANYLANPFDVMAMAHHGFLGADGKCFSFDHRANGYSRGEGVGSVIVKRLSDAIRDGNTIRAVIRGTGVNQDGRTAGITLPSAAAQEALIREVYASAGLELSETRMLEAHGTGTAAGDPIEANAAARVFGPHRKNDEPLIVGAIKSGIGHLEGGAGVAGIIKAILILENGVIPPNVNFEKANPKIPVSRWKLKFPVENMPWPSEGLRRISVNSFGVGGTNGHAILDDAYSYLSSRGVLASHNTRISVPSQREIQEQVVRLKELATPTESEQDKDSATKNDETAEEKALKSKTNGQAGVEDEVKGQSNGQATGDEKTTEMNGQSNGHFAKEVASSRVKDQPVAADDGAVANGQLEGNMVNANLMTGGKLNGETNGHTESPSGISTDQSPDSVSQVFVFSSFDEQGVRRNAIQLADYLRQKKPIIQDTTEYQSRLALTLSNYRSIFPWKSFCIGNSLDTLIENINAEGSLPLTRTQTNPRIGFVFTGQGAQWYAMGRELLAFPLYRACLEEASAYMKTIGAEWDLIDALAASKEDSLINSPALSHPACVSLQMAVVDLLQSWNVTPAAVVGHSSGEIAAAYAAGRLSRRAAWKAAYWRGRVSAKQLAAKGAMMAVGLSSADLEPYMTQVRDSGGEIAVACLNSPKNNTVSGDEDNIDHLKDLLDKDNVFARKLNVMNAYHSAHMREVAEAYRQGMGDLSGETPERASLGVRMFSTVTGEETKETLLNADYWVENMISPVRFADALLAMGTQRASEKSLQLNSGAEYSLSTIVEVGPHGAMRSAVKETLSTQPGGKAVTYLRVLDRSKPGADILLSAAGTLWCQGTSISIEAVNRSSTGGKQPQMLADLPPYNFNHSERVIMESRLSKNFRLRKHKRHDLFGAPVTDWNCDNPQWRQIIRLSELPWLRDHVITGSYVYPGVGYIIMAIEASRQMANPSAKVTGFRLVDISIRRALIVPDDKGGIETSLTLSKWDEASQWTSSVWNRFSISSYNTVGDAWVEHCTGYIQVEYEAKTNPIDNGREAECETAQWSETLRDTFEQCQSSMDIDRVYDNLVTTGMNFGPMFRNLSNVKGSGQQSGEASTTITVPDIASVMPKNHMHRHLIHPSTMDSIFHHFLLSVLDLTDKATLDSAIVPVFVKDVWVSANIPSAPGSQLRGHGRSWLVAYEKYESDINVWHGDSDEGLLSIKGLRATPLESSTTAGPQRRELCHAIEWTPAEEFLTPESFSKVPLSSLSEDNEYRIWLNKLQLASICHITDALKSLPADFEPEKLRGHAKNYHNWLLHQKSQLDVDRILHLTKAQWSDVEHNADAKTKLYKEVEAHNGDGALAVRMGANIIPFLCGHTDSDPLQTMFKDKILDQVYDEVAGLGNISQLFPLYVNHLYKTTSNLRVLEIGAGTGSSTETVLQGLSSVSKDDSEIMTTRMIQYTFTDVSAGFFEKAKERFSPWMDIMDFQTYNVEQDPATQGIAIGTYDLVVAGNVVHTTSNLKNTLTHLRSLLKPGGKLLMQEGVRQDTLWSPLAFGQLSGWWQGSEPSRKWSPWVTVPEWEGYLRGAGFDGITLQFADNANADLHTHSLFVATAQDEIRTLDRQNIIVVTSAAEPSNLAKALSERLGCRSMHYLDVGKEELREKVVVSTIECEKAVLAHLNEEEYLSIRHLLSMVDGLLWLTGDMEKDPEMGMICGMLRSIRWERDVDEANLLSMAIADSAPTEDDMVSSVMRVFDFQFRQKKPRTVNAEYILKEGQLLTNRLIENPIANDYLNSKSTKPAPQMLPLEQAGRPIKLSTSAPGMLNALEFVTDAAYYEPLDGNLVEIEIKAVGLNFRDVMIAMGEHMAYSLGNEAAGIVTRVGKDVPDLNVGDRVVYMCGFEAIGCFHTYGRVQWQNVVKIPDSLSFEIAAGLPCVYTTVIYGLYDIARLSEGETVLIHAAAGGVGQAAIQLAQNVGAEVFATVSSIEKKKLLMEEYNVREDHIFSSRDLTFVKGIKRMTGGRGVDVLLNSLSGESLRGSWDIIAPFGRFIEIGKKDSQGGGRIPLAPFLRQTMMASVELPMMMRHKPLLFRRLIGDTIRLYTEGKIHEARPTKIMSYEKIEEALRMLQSGRGMGKIVLVPSPTDLVPITPEPQAPYKLDPNATYVLAGGLGGIGRSIAKWMASKGARHVVFLSRTGTVTESVQETIDQLKALSCEAHIFACDITSEAAVQKMVDEVQKTMPPIKGCIQGAMVLRDCMFENMKYEDFQTAVLPKVRGSWHLHQHLPRDMDFFVMLSSATGIVGNRSQANYAAGNNFQDWLARSRASQGLPATSIDLGTVLSVGYVAEHRENMTTLADVLEVIREDEIHVLLEHVMGLGVHDENSEIDQSQLVVGLTSLESLRQRGVPPLGYLDAPLFAHLNAQSPGLVRGNSEDPAHLAILALPHASTREEAEGIIRDGIRHKLASLLAIPAENVDPSKSVSSNGVDSLVAMEFRAWVVKGLGADIPLLDIMGTGSLSTISQKVAKVSSILMVGKS